MHADIKFYAIQTFVLVFLKNKNNVLFYLVKLKAYFKNSIF